MNNDLSLLVQDIPKDDIEYFTKNTKSNIEAKEIINKSYLDYSWIDKVEEAIPSLDSIIRNPRRFIVSEEDVVRIEKTKKVSLESIKDLAVHTNYIQEVDEDGFVKPIKLLNIFKEETIDLYENRFIYSLIKKLRFFVQDQLTYKEQSTSNTNEKSLKYEGTTNYKNQNITISIDLHAKDNIVDEENEAITKEREEKIQHIKDVLDDFEASKFMKMMKNATEVRSPIRKTNLILKDYNFNKALYLWEYLEGFETTSPQKIDNKENNLYTNTMNNKLDLTYFVNYCILNNINTKNGNITTFQSENIIESLFEYAKKFDINEKDLRKELEQKINEASNYKNNEKNNARKALKQFVENHEVRFSKAANLFK